MPPDTSIVMATILMQRSKEVWGPDAEEFNVDRWHTSEGQQMARDGFMSWNFGPRTVSSFGHQCLIIRIEHLAVSRTALCSDRCAYIFDLIVSAPATRGSGQTIASITSCAV